MNRLEASPDWVVEPPYRVLTPDRYHSGHRPDQIYPIDGVVYHYTASTKKAPARDWLTRADDVYVSAHFIIDRDGTVEQLAPLTDRTFHAGGSTFLGRPHTNQRTIGVEIVNVGPLISHQGGFWTVNNEGRPSRPFSGAMVSAHNGRSPYTVWEAYSAPAIEAVCRLTAVLAEIFPIIRSAPASRLIGHEAIDPARKIDPGPAFPWELIRAAATGDF